MSAVSYTDSEQAAQKGIEELFKGGLIPTIVHSLMRRCDIQRTASVVIGVYEKRRIMFYGIEGDGRMNHFWMNVYRLSGGREWQPFSATLWKDANRVEDLIRQSDGTWVTTTVQQD